MEVGRAFLVLTLIFTFPLLVLPCRNALHSLLNNFSCFQCECIGNGLIIQNGSQEQEQPLVNQQQIIHVYTQSPDKTLKRFDSFMNKDVFSTNDVKMSRTTLILLTTSVIVTALACG